MSAFFLTRHHQSLLLIKAIQRLISHSCTHVIKPWNYVCIYVYIYIKFHGFIYLNYIYNLIDLWLTYRNEISIYYILYTYNLIDLWRTYRNDISIYIYINIYIYMSILFNGFMAYVQEWDLNPIYKDKFHWTVLISKKVWWWLVKKADTSYLENLCHI